MNTAKVLCVNSVKMDMDYIMDFVYNNVLKIHSSKIQEYVNNVKLLKIAIDVIRL